MRRSSTKPSASPTRQALRAPPPFLPALSCCSAPPCFSRDLCRLSLYMSVLSLSSYVFIVHVASLQECGWLNAPFVLPSLRPPFSWLPLNRVLHACACAHTRARVCVCVYERFFVTQREKEHPRWGGCFPRWEMKGQGGGFLGYKALRDFLLRGVRGAGGQHSEWRAEQRSSKKVRSGSLVPGLPQVPRAGLLLQLH